MRFRVHREVKMVWSSSVHPKRVSQMVKMIKYSIKGQNKTFQKTFAVLQTFAE